MPLLQQFFRPEFLNRLDDIILFNPVDKEMLQHIVDIQLEQYQAMLAKEKGIQLNFSQEAKEFLAEKGWDPIFGARPLKRAIQRYFLDTFALEIIDGKIISGNKVEVGEDKEADSLRFSIK